MQNKPEISGLDGNTIFLLSFLTPFDFIDKLYNVYNKTRNTVNILDNAAELKNLARTSFAHSTQETNIFFHLQFD